MNAQELAEKFDTTARSLDTKGHLIVVRRARSYLTEGRPDLAASFLVEATRRMPGSPIRALSDAFQSWRRNEGDLDTLLAEPRWSESAQRENTLAQTIQRQTQDLGHRALLIALTGETPDESVDLEEDVNPSIVPDWADDEPTSEVFEAPSTIYERPMHLSTPPPKTFQLPDPLVAGVIVMLQALTIYFCFFRPA